MLDELLAERRIDALEHVVEDEKLRLTVRSRLSYQLSENQESEEIEVRL